MPSRSLLLRVLLSLVLVVNGVGSAVASGSVGDMEVPSACHGQHAGDDMASQDAPVPMPDETPAPDCCQSGLCGCACAQAAQMTMPGPGLTPVPAGHPLVKPLPLGYPAPALPQPTRPPIG